MNPFAIFTRRIRGFRVIDIAAVLIIVVTALASYAFKTSAGAEDADANGVETQILDQEKRIRLLDAEIARLDDPTRVEALSTQYLGMGPVSARQDITLVDLSRVASHPPHIPPSPAGSAAAPVPPAGTAPPSIAAPPPRGVGR